LKYYKKDTIPHPIPAIPKDAPYASANPPIIPVIGFDRATIHKIPPIILITPSAVANPLDFPPDTLSIFI
jgi:hypothetical protein